MQKSQISHCVIVVKMSFKMCRSQEKISSETAGELKEDMVIYQIYWNKRMKKN